MAIQNASLYFKINVPELPKNFRPCQFITSARLEIFTAMKIQVDVLFVVTPCNYVVG